MNEMTAEERRAFLAHGTRTGKLATVRADGSPHAVPVWFVLDGDELVFMTWHDSVQARSILRDGRMTLVVDDEAFPSLALLVVAGYCANQSNGHRREERRAKARQLDINAVEPLLSRLSEDEQREIRTEIAGRLIAEAPPTKDDPRSALPVGDLGDFVAKIVSAAKNQ